MSKVVRIGTRSAVEWRNALARLGRGTQEVRSSGALRAELVGHHETWHGLPDAWADTLNRLGGRIDAVVYSYHAPIAVRVILDGGRIWDDSAPTAWVMPGFSWSVTTSRHQNLIEKATGALRTRNAADVVGVFCGSPAVAETAVALWPEWSGSVDELIITAQKLAEEVNV